MSDDLVLAHLQRTYGKTWRIWRTPNWWMANPRVDGPPPTLMERTAFELEERILNPGEAIGQRIVPWPRNP